MMTDFITLHTAGGEEWYIKPGSILLMCWAGDRTTVCLVPTTPVLPYEIVVVEPPEQILDMMREKT